MNDAELYALRLAALWEIENITSDFSKPDDEKLEAIENIFKSNPLLTEITTSDEPYLDFGGDYPLKGTDDGNE